MAADTPDRDAVAAVIASNLVAPAGVFLLGWSATVLFGVLAAEFTALVCWSLVKMPFAAKRPRGGAVDRSRVAGLLHRLRGSISLPGPLPPVYPRNAMPLLGGVVFGTIGVVIALAVVGAVASEGLADGEATAIGLGFVVVFLFRAAETVVEYFLHGGYRDHSARSAFFEPLVAAFGLTLLLVAALTLEAAGLGGTVRAAETLAVLAVGKAALDVRGLRIEADDDRYGVLARMFGGQEIELDPEPIDEPDTEPVCRVRPARAAAVVDAAGRGLAYLVTSGPTWFGILLTVVAGLVGGLGAGVTVGAVVLLPFAVARAVARYLTYGAVEYRCYDGLLVVHSTLLGAGQARLRRQAVEGVTIERDFADRLFDTETLVLDAEGPDTTPEPGLPDPEAEPADGVNEDRPRTLAHVREPEVIVDTLGVAWVLERDG